MHPHSSYPFFHHNRGFSLVELMVGMTIGLLVVLVIMQSFSIFETQKRTTTAGSDAQSSGLMAMTQLEQEIRNSGAGFTGSAAFDCSNMYSYYGDNTAGISPVPAFSGGMAPVTITDGGTGSDTIIIKRGTDFLGSIPASITEAMPNTSAELKVSFTQGFTVGDKIIVSQGGNCTVMEVTHTNESSLQIQHNSGGSGPSYNPPGNFYNTAPGNTWPGANPPTSPSNYSTGAKVLNIGDMLVKTYSIDTNNNLQVVDSSTNLASSATYTLVKDIVSLQAQYGIADASSQTVNNWVDATGTWSALDSTEIKRIKAIRLTIVARSSKKEISDVTASAPGGVNVSNLTDWQKYRYRVYTTIIPLRNIIWSNV